VIVWLWDTSGPSRNERGITDNQARAQQAAEARLHSGEASAARVERAVTILGIHTLTTGYQRTGDGWSAQHHDGRITWTPFAGQWHLADE
jgi:hypothetical protein